MNTSGKKQAVSIYEFALMHSIGRSTVYAEIRRGRLVVFKVGRRTLISSEAAEAWRRRAEAERIQTVAA